MSNQRTLSADVGLDAPVPLRDVLACVWQHYIWAGLAMRLWCLLCVLLTVALWFS